MKYLTTLSIENIENILITSFATLGISILKLFANKKVLLEQPTTLIIIVLSSIIFIISSSMSDKNQNIKDRLG